MYNAQTHNTNWNKTHTTNQKLIETLHKHTDTQQRQQPHNNNKQTNTTSTTNQQTHIKHTNNTYQQKQQSNTNTHKSKHDIYNI